MRRVALAAILLILSLFLFKSLVEAQYPPDPDSSWPECQDGTALCDEDDCRVDTGQCSEESGYIIPEQGNPTQGYYCSDTNPDCGATGDYTPGALPDYTSCNASGSYCWISADDFASAAGYYVQYEVNSSYCGGADPCYWSETCYCSSGCCASEEPVEDPLIVDDTVVDPPTGDGGDDPPVSSCGPPIVTRTICDATYQREVCTYYEPGCGTNFCFTQSCLGEVSGTAIDSASGGTCATLTPGVGGATVTINEFPLGGYPDPGGICDLSWSGTADASGFYSASNLCVSEELSTTYQISVSAAGFSSASACGVGDIVTMTSYDDSDQKDFSLGDFSNSWFQIEGWSQVTGDDLGIGNVYAGGEIVSPIPDTCDGDPDCDPYFMTVATTDDDAGVVTYGGASPDFGSGQASEVGWNANSTYDDLQYDFGFFFNQLGFSASSTPDYTGGDIDKPIDPPLSGTVYYVSSSMTIANPWSIATGEQIVFLIDGDLSVAAEVTVDEDGFVAFIVSGNITIDTAVGGDGPDAQVEGVYVADGVFGTGSSTDKLILEGTFVGWTGVSLDRDFGGAQNNTEPAEVFRYRPDIKQAAPDYLGRPKISWQEVAP